MKKEFFNIAKLIDKNSKVLDVGCGNCDLMKYARVEKINISLTSSFNYFFKL